VSGEKTALPESPTLASPQNREFSQAARTDHLKDDPRWQLTLRVVASRHFARSPLLAKFLLFIVQETLEGRQEEITQHKIGVRVFGRPPGYRTVEDNIVRNYARQLRKRLAEHSTLDGSADLLRIEIPLGGYIPVFTDAAEVNATAEERDGPEPVFLKPRVTSVPKPVVPAKVATRWRGKYIVACTLLVAAYSAALISLTWFAADRVSAPRHVTQTANPFWRTMLEGPSNTYIVLPDAGLNLLEDLSRHPMQLADYIKGGYLQLPLTQFDRHSATDMRTEQVTSFADVQIVADLSRRPEFDPRRVFLRFPRDLRLDDLKNANAVIIGSVGSNPWAALAANSANFSIVYSDDMRGATIVNRKPLAGEAASYASHWSEPAHDTYAVIAFLPNLRGDGHLLLLEGLDVAGTQAAEEAILDPNIITPILERSKQQDGSLRHFEMLLRSRSIQSNPTATEVIASRIY
jgi:hypothetical protein